MEEPRQTQVGIEPRLRRFLPWISLGLGVASAIHTSRGPRRAALVAVAVVASWLTLLLLHWLARSRIAEPGHPRSRLVRVLHHSSLAVTQSAVQLGLFFALPLYVHAATPEPLHAVFLVMLGTLSLITLWDPWTKRLLLAPRLAPLLPAVSSFVALAAVLPGLGLSTHTSLRIAATVSAVGVAVVAAARAPVDERGRALSRSLLLALLLPLSLELGAARVVPAAPLRLMKIELGTHVRDKWVIDSVERLSDAPERLFCATAIWSPVGVKDRLFHVWRYGGAMRSRIELQVRGGRAGGFRTFSRIDGFGARPAGVYSCSVETESGQVLGSRSVRIDSPRG
jgi:hypothetical protein